MPDRFSAAVAVYGILVRDDQILLARRSGTGYHDGEWSLPAGHLEGGEDALTGLARELREELLIDISRAACRLVLVMHRAREHADDLEYLDLFFEVHQRFGEPTIGEPERCSQLLWCGRQHRPPDVIGYVAQGFDAISRGELFAGHGW